MQDGKRQVKIRLTPEEEKKLERMRKTSRRPSIQNVLEAMVAMADEADSRWHASPKLTQARPQPQKEHVA